MNIRRFFTKKKIIWTIIILLITGTVYFFAKPKNNTANILTATVQEQNLKQTVLTTGQVVSATNLSLSFQTSGMVKSISVANGGQVKAGAILGVLDQSNVRPSLTSAQGQMAQASANYRKVIAGNTPEQVNISQKAVDAAQVAYNNALSQLATVKNTVAAAISQAEANLANLKPSVPTSDSKRSAIVVSISNQLVAVRSDLDQESKIIADNDFKNNFGVQNIGSVSAFIGNYNQVQALLDKANASLAAAQALESDSNINQAVSDALRALNQNITSLNNCYSALLSSITSNNFSQAKLDGYKSSISSALTQENSGITLVNSSRQALTDAVKADADAVKADADALRAAQNSLANSKLSAVSQINAAQNQINSAKAAWQQAQASLAQQKAKVLPADIAAAQAQVLSARGTLEAAQAAFDNTILKSPADGTITQVNTKVGQQATAMQTVFVLQNIAALHAEAYVSESNIASLKVGQAVDLTFDALGPDKHFNGKILTIDPASTVISGVVDYLAKASLPKIPAIKPGMTANMTILVASRDKALAITSDAIINQDGAQYVKVIDNPKKKTYHQVKVVTGLSADGGLVEVLSGLSKGEEIVTLIK